MTGNTEELSFDSFVKLPVNLFKVLLFSFKPLRENPTFFQKFVHFLMVNYHKVMLCSMVSSVTQFTIYGYVNVQDGHLVDSLAAVPNGSIVMLILLKGIFTFIYRDKIWNNWQQLKALVDKRVRDNGGECLKPYLDDYMFKIKVYGYIFVLTFLPITYPVIPFLINGTMNMTIRYWYPVDIYQKEIFFFAWLWVVYISVNACSSFIGTDSLLYSFLTVILMEFDFLKNELDDLKFTPKHLMLRKVEAFSKRHNKLMDLADELQLIYQWTFFCSFIISSLIICFICFQLTVFEADYQGYAFNVPFLGMCVGHIYLLCLHGQKLIDASTEVATGVYFSGWEDIDDIAIKKHFIMILLRAQKPKKLTAMNFAEISMPTFSSIMTTTGSYFTLLQNVYSRK